VSQFWGSARKKSSLKWWSIVMALKPKGTGDGSTDRRSRESLIGLVSSVAWVRCGAHGG
jgi:hypothetical protein